ncbi:MAG: fatty acid desaturase [Pseudomonadota bacterium]
MNIINYNEVALHNSFTDCWIVIDGNVYDISNFISQHPGGSILGIYAGEDATAAFYSSHMSNIGSELLEPYKVAEITNYQPTFKIYNDDFIITLKHRVIEYFTKNNINYKTTYKNNLNIIFSAISFIACWLLMYTLPTPFGYIAAIPMGLITCSLIGSFGHELIHDNIDIFRKKTGIHRTLLNNIMWGLFIPFMPERYFQYEHLRHHDYPVNPKYDYDVYALKDFLRLSPDIKIKKIHAYQHLYAPFIYGFYIFIQVFNGYLTSFFDKREILKDKGVILNIISMNTISIVFHIIIPIWLTDAWWVVICASTYFFTWQLAIYLSSGAPHLTDPSVHQTHKSWAFYVCSTTKNLKTSSHIVSWLTGGLNHHLAHHLLPSVPKEHLPKVLHIVEATCLEFGYPYYTYTSIKDYIKDHYLYLYKLGNNTI